MPLSEETVKKFRMIVLGITDHCTAVADLQKVFIACEPEQIRELLSQENYIYFQRLAFRGEPHMVRAMIEHCPPEQRSAMNAACHYGAFRQASTTNRQRPEEVKQVLLTFFPEDAVAMIHAGEQQIFYQAIGLAKHSENIFNGEIVDDLSFISESQIDLSSLEILLQSTTAQRQQECIQFGNYLAIKSAINRKSTYYFEILYHYASEEQRQEIAVIQGAKELIQQSRDIETPYTSYRSTEDRYQKKNHSKSLMREARLKFFVPGYLGAENDEKKTQVDNLVLKQNG